ncbi:hypothetical protein [Arthrobacter oryzae]|uniref:hypothetical protein n=1 Tax=Arthrobacter oryzae TaxID=409290 RepID=UPI00285F80EB|nr:hypothetical protein [Arthrobacter oryzae]MDR6506266.1 hypothetical protein [Arthrobacter oryzae]
MFNQDKQFRRPDGTLYDPSSFNVRQYEEQYGPGGVPEGYAMDAITPVQSPGLIIALGVFTSLVSVGLLSVSLMVIGSGGELKLILFAFAVGIGGLAMSVQAFRIAVKRRRWLRQQQTEAAGVNVPARPLTKEDHP